MARDANNLGQILKTKGDLDAAQRHTERALEIRQKVFGPDHPSTRTTAESLRYIRALLKKARPLPHPARCNRS